MKVVHTMQLREQLRGQQTRTAMFRNLWLILHVAGICRDLRLAASSKVRAPAWLQRRIFVNRVAVLCAK